MPFEPYYITATEAEHLAILTRQDRLTIAREINRSDEHVNSLLKRNRRITPKNISVLKMCEKKAAELHAEKAAEASG